MNRTPTSEDPWIETSLSGYDLINQPMLNKGTAFTDEERDNFALHGLLPPHLGAMEDQIKRRLRALLDIPLGFEQYAFLRDLQDANETPFYALLAGNIEKLLPVVYTPTVGEGCRRFSEIWRKPRGLFLSYPHKDRIVEILAHPRFDQVRCIVVSDGERILGLGDQGAGGMGIPIGKLSLYTALAGIHPSATLPVLLDVGTDNQETAERSGLYRLVSRAGAGSGVRRLHRAFCRRRHRAVAARAAAVGRLRRGHRSLAGGHQCHRQTAQRTTHRHVRLRVRRRWYCLAHGHGSGGSRPEPCRGAWPSVRRGQGWTSARRRSRSPGTQQPFAKKRSVVTGWKLAQPDKIPLLDVIHNAKPTVLIGASGQAGAFTEEIVRAITEYAERPIIFPLSNPTSRSEATPQDLLEWSNSTAVVGTGGPFPPVSRLGQPVSIYQTNNSYIFPGVALGLISAQVRRVTDSMFMAAAKTLAKLSPTVTDKKGRLLPPVTEIRSVSMAIGMAVAEQARKENLAMLPPGDNLEQAVRSNVWDPRYLPYRPPT